MTKRAWTTQRILNNIPMSENARRLPFSLTQQLINSVGLDIQDVYQQLNKARFNSNISSFDITTPDKTFYLELPTDFNFTYTTDSNGELIYTPPSVYGVEDGTEYTLTQAEENNIETFIGNNIPTRIVNENTSKSYTAVLPRTLISSVASTSLNDIVVPSYLFISVRGNETWRHEFQETIYYPKVRITGTTRKKTKITEEVPIQKNGVYKTINEWQSIDSIETYYLDDDAYLTVETFPFDAEYQKDLFNIYVSETEIESFLFYKLDENTTSGTYDLVGYSETSNDLQVIQQLNFEKDDVLALQLLDDTGSAISLNSFYLPNKPNLCYSIDNTYLYVHDIRLPNPDTTLIDSDDPESNIDIYSNRWIIREGDYATFSLRVINKNNPPYRFRIKLTDSSGDYWLGLNGTKWSTGSTSGWIENNYWEVNGWKNIYIKFQIDNPGDNLITVEAVYSSTDTIEFKTKKSQYLFSCPTINSTKKIELPSDLQNSTNIAMDSDGNLWFYKSGNILKGSFRYDYFLVDYEKKKIWTREDYSDLRVVK